MSRQSPRANDTVSMKWLGTAPALNFGCTFGLPWPQGLYSPFDAAFTCTTPDDKPIPLQTRIIAYWPDGSIKWTSHSISASEIAADEYLIHVVNEDHATKHCDLGKELKFYSSDDFIEVNTGKIIVSFATSGEYVMRRLTSVSNGCVLGESGRLVVLSQPIISGPEATLSNSSYQSFQSWVDSAVIEQNGPIGAVILVRGKHQMNLDNRQNGTQQEAWLPFALRFYLYLNSEAIKVVHTFIYDGNPKTSSIRGIGLQFNVLLRETELYNRHVRIAGVDDGIFGEAVQGVTGLWRDPGICVRRAQVEGRPTPALNEWNNDFPPLLKWVPSWADYTLAQLSPDGFTFKKRTRTGHSWVNIPGGTRAGGLVYLGSAHHGGLAIGMRNFWERYPTSLDVRDATKDVGHITLWLYSPVGEPMDLRHYHDGLGQATYDDQLEALKITYEDWEPGLGSPYGIARSNEIFIFGLDKTPTSKHMSHLTRYIRNPPLLVASPEYLWQTRALGTYWSPSIGLLKVSQLEEIDKRLEFLFTFYREQVSQRRWWGFWDHGDIMHTYDEDRHTWRYDVGGYAWDNSELSPDLWLWLYFLRTGRADVFRMAEALTRHTGEVDVYHAGPLKGLGTRHGVQHWGDSCKQARISNALYRRTFYFLSGGDERTGELLEETLETTKTFLTLDPYRKVRKDKTTYVPNAEALSISLGTDWSAMASSWFIEWERHGPQWAEAKAKLLESMRGIGVLKNGFVTGSALYNLCSGAISSPAVDLENAGIVRVSHLSAMFGLVEICAELIETLGDNLPEGFQNAWLDYCRYFNAGAQEQMERFGESFGKLQLRQGHSRLTAYAAGHLGDHSLARRAWEEFMEDNRDGYGASIHWRSENVNGNRTLTPVSAAPWISTNVTALYGLAAIQNLALISDDFSA